MVDSLAGNRRLMNTVSPHKMMMMQDLASGQGNIGTPLRSRIDSQDSRLGVFSNLKCDNASQFLSPNVRRKLSTHGEHPLFGASSGVPLGGPMR